jgi:hypothetical protein
MCMVFTTGTRLMNIFFLIILRVFPIYCLFLLNHDSSYLDIDINKLFENIRRAWDFSNWLNKYPIVSHISCTGTRLMDDCKHENLGANDNNLIKTDSK